MTGPVSCDKCGSELFTSIEHRPARKQRKFLWFVRPARQEHLIVTCYVCEHRIMLKPGTVKVINQSRYNPFTGRRVELQ